MTIGLGKRYPITPTVSEVVSAGSNVVQKMKCRSGLLRAVRFGRNNNHTYYVVENLSLMMLPGSRRKALASPGIVVSPVSRCCQRHDISTVGLHLQSHQERERAIFFDIGSVNRSMRFVVNGRYAEAAANGSGQRRAAGMG